MSMADNSLDLSRTRERSLTLTRLTSLAGTACTP